MKQVSKYELELPSQREGETGRRMECGREFFEALGNPDVIGGNVTADAHIMPEHDGAWLLNLTVKGVVETPCDRCLGPVTLPVDESFETEIREGLPSEMEGENIAVEPGAQSVDLTRAIADTVLLGIPLRHVHQEGECDAEMIEALRGREPRTLPGSSPFDILAELISEDDE